LLATKKAVQAALERLVLLQVEAREFV